MESRNKRPLSADGEHTVKRIKSDGEQGESNDPTGSCHRLFTSVEAPGSSGMAVPNATAESVSSETLNSDAVVTGEEETVLSDTQPQYFTLFSTILNRNFVVEDTPLTSNRRKFRTISSETDPDRPVPIEYIPEPWQPGTARCAEDNVDLMTVVGVHGMTVPLSLRREDSPEPDGISEAQSTIDGSDDDVRESDDDVRESDDDVRESDDDVGEREDDDVGESEDDDVGESEDDDASERDNDGDDERVPMAWWQDNSVRPESEHDRRLHERRDRRRERHRELLRELRRDLRRDLRRELRRHYQHMITFL